MDELQEYEVNDILDNIPYLNKPDWEMTRYNIFTNVQMNTTKKIKATDIIKFPWDNVEDVDISNQDIERLKKKSELIRKNIINNGK